MIIDSKYTKKFNSNSLTKAKFNELYDYALYIREFKNELSKEVNSNLLFYLDMSKFSFIKHVRNNFPLKLHSNFDTQAIATVFVAYQNKFKATQRKLIFNKVTFEGFEFYKRNTKNKKKGDFKKVKLGREKTKLSTCITYLARYGDNNTIIYITNKLKESTLDNKQKEFYNSILQCCNKFGFERLLTLAMQKRSRVIEYYSKKPIEFKSLTFGGRSRKKRIINYNKHYNSTINSFVTLSWEGGKSMDIPVKFSKDYHGLMKDYKKNNPDYEYVLCFDERRKQVQINICKDGERYIPEVNGDIVGIDVNVKHNLFSLSNGDSYDYDRKLVNDYSKLMIETDKLKECDGYSVGKRRQFKINTLKRKIVKSEQQLISSICKRLQLQGVGHVVMENLDNGFGKSFFNDNTNEGINFNRIVNFLGISSLKQEFEHIGRKYGITLSTVHSSYTSKLPNMLKKKNGMNTS